MRKYIIVWSYWLGTACATVGLFARGLDLLGKNFIDFNTRGGGIGYHSMMDGTLFFYAISIGNAGYHWFISQGPARAVARDDRRSAGAGVSQEVISSTQS